MLFVNTDTKKIGVLRIIVKSENGSSGAFEASINNAAGSVP
jgi:hypothetical protein